MQPEAFSNPPANYSHPVSEENQDFWDNFHQQVLQRLEDMENLLEQGEQPEYRRQLQSHCQQLANWGKAAKLPQWVELLETAAEAFANPDNPYEAATKLIIEEIRQAREQILAGETDRLGVSEELQALAISLSSSSAKLFPEQEQKAAGEIDVEDLLSLFEENAPLQPALDTSPSKPLAPARNTFTPLPLDGEIQDLFREDFLWDEENLPPPSLDFFDLVEPEKDGENLSPGSELPDLLILEDRQEKEAEKIAILAYEPLEELEAFLEAPAAAIAGELSPLPAWHELESVLEALPPTPTVAIPSPLKPAPRELEMAQLSLEEEFKDLEQLLEEAEGTLGGPPALQTMSGKRLPSRARTPKTKVFEQTMRVPVKQLDNLSNLIGELIVKRNRLEQDQERLRQFLENLVNQVQRLNDMGGRMQDLHEQTLLEGALLATPQLGVKVKNRSRLPERGEAAGTLSLLDIQSTIEQDLDALEMDRFTGFHLLSQEMIELVVRVRESASDIQFLVDETEQVARSLRQVTTQLQEGMTQSRMVPFAQAADRLPRAVRDISLKLNKQARLQVEGRDVLIDKMILEHLYNPMTHLINNAITHGIESPEVRSAQGKSPVGSIKVRAFLQGNQTVISVSDDGAGIDPDQVKAKAIAKELLSRSEAASLSQQEIYDLLFLAGFTTKDKADDFAGRGVGLDVVRTSLSEIRGSATIESELGKGTTFSIRLPLTLSICNALCCLSDRARIAFPMDGVEDAKDYAYSEIQTNAQGQTCVPWRDTLLPFQPLRELLSYNRQLARGSIYGGKQEEDSLSIVVLRSAGNYLALQVDRILVEEEIVIKQIEGPIPKTPGIAGATVLGDGTIMPIGDVLELMEIAQGRMRLENYSNFWQTTPFPVAAETEVTKIEPTVLIVDDSITVRELLSLSFRKVGYRVEQARDGQEAWEKLRSGLPCDLVFCDIEMPRMNGLELLSNLQKDEELAGIPVALLTSRGAARHRKVAAQLGASGYFIKPYTEKDLLDSAQRMLRGEILLRESVKASQRILIVDDSVTVREMLSITFIKAGYQAEQARDGQEAWEKLNSGLSYDLILCDIEMPRMNGLELLSLIKQDPKLTSIPVAMITSRGAQKMQRIAAELGARAYFVKPYVEEVLVETAKRLMGGEVFLDKNNLVEIGDEP